MEIVSLVGAEIAPALPALAELRIRVFRDWPYLYDGSAEYEAEYLGKFAADPRAFVAIARDGERIVGASTASPLLGHADAFASPFAARGMHPERVFYLGESVLEPAYRGRGIGHAFFDAREAHGRGLGGFETAAFCAVVRSPDDPRRPADYRPLDAFWSKRGYARADGLVATFDWKEVGGADEEPHAMQFWTKAL